MASYVRQKPPSWFVIVALLLTLWGLAGCFSFYLHWKYGVAMKPEASAWESAYTAALPRWFLLIFAIAVGGGLLGSLALLTRSKKAIPLYTLSLIAVIVQFGYVFALTDLIAHKGAAMTVPFPLVIAAIALFQIWFAKRAERRGWIS
jgi:hypothetical protein